MASTNPTLPATSFIGNDDWRWWLGTVLNADDKDAKLGRVKVNILGYHRPKEKPEDLPWAMVMAPTDSAGANGVGSAPAQIKPGSFVVGFFLDYPDCQQPIVIGTLLSKIEDVVEPTSQDRWDYPGSFENTVQRTKSDVTDRGVSAASLAGQASMSAAAASSPHSDSNPSGVVKEAPIADGKNAGDKTFTSNVTYAFNHLGNTMKYLNTVKPKTTTLSVDIDSEEQSIPVQSTEGFPTIGILDVGGEKIGYNNLNSKTFVLAKRGQEGSTPKKHSKGTTVKLIPKGEYQGGKGGTSKEGDNTGSFIHSLVDVKRTIDSVLEFIEDSMWWLVNQIKSFLMGQITKILNAIGIAAISPIPMFGKLLTDVILFILKEIACILDQSLMDSLMSAVEDAIMEFVNGALGAIGCVVDAIFGTIFNLVSLAEQIISLVNDIISTFSSIGNLSDISNLSSLNVISILDFIFGLLNIGCNRDTRDPFDITFSMCDLANLGGCGGIGGYNIDISGIPGRINPEYSKLIGTFSETGTMVLMDDTPYNSRLVIEHGPSKSGIHVYDNGDVRITNSSKKTEVTIKDEEIIVHGNYKMVVDGNYHLKVGRDMHIEVLGMYNLAVNRESKITYAGEHNTYFKNDSKLEANNGLALVASKLGISCSGQYEIHSPIMTSFATEQNHFALGSHNVITLFQNNFIGLNKVKMVAGNNLYARVGTNFEQGIGLSNVFQTGLENEWWGGQHNQVGLGVWTENKLAVDQENTTGVTAFTKQGVYFDQITAAAFKNTTGLLLDTAEGVLVNTSAAVLKITAPIVSIN
jgi:hypothetical protein